MKFSDAEKTHRRAPELDGNTVALYCHTADHFRDAWLSSAGMVEYKVMAWQSLQADLA